MKIFVVEDDTFYRQYLKHNLNLIPGYEIQEFSTGAELLAYSGEWPEVITLDYSLPDISCEQLIQELQTRKITSSVIVVSAQEDVTTAVQLLKSGVYDYVVKNDETRERLLITLKHFKEKYNLEREIQGLREEVKAKYDFSKIIKGTSREIESIFALLEKAVKTSITVSITGETGTGKELVAKAIHFNSRHRKKNFVTVNMAAIPSELIESELFGHEKGAFTGAENKRIGKFEEANGGSIFLDEIADLNLGMQAKLLRVLQEKEITRIGGSKKIKIDTRIIVATHKNLVDEVKEGRFREDLYYRLLGLPIKLPPLRERKSDIVLLSKHFVDEFSEENELGAITINSLARRKLMEYHWPGNVRELKAVVELSAVLCTDNIIREKDITFNSVNRTPHLLLQEMTLNDYTRSIIQYTLDQNNSNVVLAASKLQIGKSTIYRMLKKGEIKLN